MLHSPPDHQSAESLMRAHPFCSFDDEYIRTPVCKLQVEKSAPSAALFLLVTILNLATRVKSGTHSAYSGIRQFPCLSSVVMDAECEAFRRSARRKKNQTAHLSAATNHPMTRFSPTHITRRALTLSLLLGAIATPVGTALADALNPLDFPSLGTQTIAVGDYTLNTDTLTFGSFTGTISGGGIAVFNFDALSVDTDARIFVTGSRPLALLAVGALSFAGTIYAREPGRVTIFRDLAGLAWEVLVWAVADSVELVALRSPATVGASAAVVEANPSFPIARVRAEGAVDLEAEGVAAMLGAALGSTYRAVCLTGICSSTSMQEAVEEAAVASSFLILPTEAEAERVVGPWK